MDVQAQPSQSSPAQRSGESVAAQQHAGAFSASLKRAEQQVQAVQASEETHNGRFKSDKTLVEDGSEMAEETETEHSLVRKIGHRRRALEKGLRGLLGL